MIKDSGNRREFDSGAVRDIQEGKGRCDLLPLDVIMDAPLTAIERFKETGVVSHLRVAINSANFFSDLATMLLEVSKHFEEGAKKSEAFFKKLGFVCVGLHVLEGKRHEIHNEPDGEKVMREMAETFNRSL